MMKKKRSVQSRNSNGNPPRRSRRRRGACTGEQDENREPPNSSSTSSTTHKSSRKNGATVATKSHHAVESTQNQQQNGKAKKRRREKNSPTSVSKVKNAISTPCTPPPKFASLLALQTTNAFAASDSTSCSSSCSQGLSSKHDFTEKPQDSMEDQSSQQSRHSRRRNNNKIRTKSRQRLHINPNALISPHLFSTHKAPNHQNLHGYHPMQISAMHRHAGQSLARKLARQRFLTYSSHATTPTTAQQPILLHRPCSPAPLQQGPRYFLNTSFITEDVIAASDDQGYIDVLRWAPSVSLHEQGFATRELHHDRKVSTLLLGERLRDQKDTNTEFCLPHPLPYVAMKCFQGGTSIACGLRSGELCILSTESGSHATSKRNGTEITAARRRMTRHGDSGGVNVHTDAQKMRVTSRWAGPNRRYHRYPTGSSTSMPHGSALLHVGIGAPPPIRTSSGNSGDNHGFYLNNNNDPWHESKSHHEAWDDTHHHDIDTHFEQVENWDQHPDRSWEATTRMRERWRHHHQPSSCWFQPNVRNDALWDFCEQTSHLVVAHVEPEKDCFVLRLLDTRMHGSRSTGGDTGRQGSCKKTAAMQVYIDNSSEEHKISGNRASMVEDVTALCMAGDRMLWTAHTIQKPMISTSSSMQQQPMRTVVKQWDVRMFSTSVSTTNSRNRSCATKCTSPSYPLDKVELCQPLERRNVSSMNHDLEDVDLDTSAGWEYIVQMSASDEGTVLATFQNLQGPPMDNLQTGPDRANLSIYGSVPMYRTAWLDAKHMKTLAHGCHYGPALAGGCIDGHNDFSSSLGEDCHNNGGFFVPPCLDQGHQVMVCHGYRHQSTTSLRMDALNGSTIDEDGHHHGHNDDERGRENQPSLLLYDLSRMRNQTKKRGKNDASVPLDAWGGLPLENVKDTWGVPSQLTCTAVSPHGTSIVCGTGDGDLYLWA